MSLLRCGPAAIGDSPVCLSPLQFICHDNLTYTRICFLKNTTPRFMLPTAFACASFWLETSLLAHSNFLPTYLLLIFISNLWSFVFFLAVRKRLYGTRWVSFTYPLWPFWQGNLRFLPHIVTHSYDSAHKFAGEESYSRDKWTSYCTYLCFWGMLPLHCTNWKYVHACLAV